MGMTSICKYDMFMIIDLHYWNLTKGAPDAVHIAEGVGDYYIGCFITVQSIVILSSVLYISDTPA